MAGVGVVYRDASVVTARPVVPGPISTPAPPEALAAGSQINMAAVGGPTNAAELTSGSSLDKAQAGAPWPAIINGAIKFFNSWRPNGYKEIANHNIGGNYGSKSSLANYGFRGQEFPASEGGIAGSPMPINNPYIPEWNNLVPVIYGLRVLNPVSNLGAANTSNTQSTVSQFTSPAEFVPTGTASLSMKGEVLQ